MGDLGEWRPGFYSEFRYESIEHSGLAWGAILRKIVVSTLIPRLAGSFFQEQVPKMDYSPNAAIRKEHGGAYKYIYRCIYTYKYISLTWAPARPPGHPPPTRPPVPGPCKVYMYLLAPPHTTKVFRFCSYIQFHIVSKCLPYLNGRGSHPYQYQYQHRY